MLLGVRLDEQDCHVLAFCMSILQAAGVEDVRIEDVPYPHLPHFDKGDDDVWRLILPREATTTHQMGNFLHEVAHALVAVVERGVGAPPVVNFGHGAIDGADFLKSSGRPHVAHREAIVQSVQFRLHEHLGITTKNLSLEGWIHTQDTDVWGDATFNRGLQIILESVGETRI